MQMPMLSCTRHDDYPDKWTAPSSAGCQNARLTLMISYVWRDNFRRLLPEFRNRIAALKKYQLESWIFARLTLIRNCIPVSARARATTSLWAITRTWCRASIFGLHIRRYIATIAISWLYSCVCKLFLIIWFTIIYTVLWSVCRTVWSVMNIVILILVMIVEIWVVRETFSVKSIAWNDQLNQN